MTGLENTSEMKFSAFLEQIEKCVSLELYYVAIMACLALPDIAGSIDSNEGKADGSKYQDWFDKYVAPKYHGYGENLLTGKVCFSLRCSMLHEGVISYKDVEKYTDIIFCEFPQTNSLVDLFLLTTKKVLLIEPKTFCYNMIGAAYDWLEVVHNKELFKINTSKFMTLFSLSFTDVKSIGCNVDSLLNPPNHK